jgi:translation initiation factor IF-2
MRISSRSLEHQTKQTKMKIDNLITSGTLPKGEIIIAALSNQTCRISKWKNVIKNIPHGVARCRSKYSQCNLVILLQDALNHGIPYITTKSLKNH